MLLFTCNSNQPTASLSEDTMHMHTGELSLAIEKPNNEKYTSQTNTMHTKHISYIQTLKVYLISLAYKTQKFTHESCLKQKFIRSRVTLRWPTFIQEAAGILGPRLFEGLVMFCVVCALLQSRVFFLLLKRDACNQCNISIIKI